jgi:DNA-binding CsgD family transcriptional regulator
LQAVNGDDVTPSVSERVTLSAAGIYRAGLTPRELQALRCMANGYTNRQIAGELGVTLKSARNLVSAVLAKLDAVNRAEAVAIAGREGLLS